jgi:peroxiredoxin
MTITVKSTLPIDYTLQFIDTKTNQPASLKLKDLYKGTFVLVGVPAAFSPPCSELHLPSFLDQLSSFQQKGAKVIVISRDNLFAQRAWAKKFGVDEKQDQVIFASDVELALIKELGLSTKEVEPLGEVASRFAIIAKDGEVTYVGQEKTVGEVTVSSADSVLKEL